MSLFHKTEENAGPVTFTDKEAVVAILFLSVTADAEIAPEEEELVVAASNRMKLLRDQGIADFNATVERVRDAIDAKGRAEVLAAGVKGLPAELKETVYALAGDIVFADGTALPEELTFLREAQEALGVPDELATKVIEVMRIKNRG
jgi:tellurite resistance protein